MSAIREKVRSFVSAASSPQNVAQITIDFFSDFDFDIFVERNEEEDPIWRDEIGAQVYLINNLLEVMDATKFQTDIRLLTEMKALLDLWEKEIEDNNRVLGIPIYKG